MRPLLTDAVNGMFVLMARGLQPHRPTNILDDNGLQGGSLVVVTRTLSMNFGFII